MTKREHYLDKWNNNRTNNYIPEQGETFVQCSYPHPDYWFLSSCGRLFSTYREVKQLHVYVIPTGQKNSKGERPGRTWVYYSKVNGKTKLYTVHSLVAHYFLKDEFLSSDPMDVHHKRKSLLFDDSEPFKANRADNLQLLPKPIHKTADGMTESGIRKKEEQLEREVSKGLPVISVTNIEKTIMLLLQDAIKQGITPVIYMPDGDEQVEAIPITLSMLHLDDDDQLKD